MAPHCLSCHGGSLASKSTGTVVALATGGLKQSGSTHARWNGQQHVQPHSTAQPHAGTWELPRTGAVSPAWQPQIHAQILPAGWESKASACQEGGSFCKANSQAGLQSSRLQRSRFVPLRGTENSGSMGSRAQRRPGDKPRSQPTKEPPGRRKGTSSPCQHSSLPSAHPTLGILLLLSTYPAPSRAGELGAAPRLEHSSVSRAFIQ